MEWYPSDRKELTKVLDYLLSKKVRIQKEIHGLVVPHAGYQYSGAIAGKAFALLKDYKIKKAIIFGPSHRVAFRGMRAIAEIETPLGKIKIPGNDFQKIDYEHSVENQVPFLQKLGFREILPLVVGDIDDGDAKKIAKKISEIDSIHIFSTDLSHFLPYEEANKKDKESIKIIENLDIGNFKNIDACGKFPLLIMMHLCKLKKYKPKLIEYKNSGDITGDKSSVVGYAGFWF